MTFIYILDTCVKENTKILFPFMIYWEFWKSILMDDINPRISKKHFIKNSQFSHRKNKIGGNNFEEKSLDTIERVET